MSVQYDPSTGSPYWAPPPPPRRAGVLIAIVLATAVAIGTIVTVVDRAELR